MGLRWCVVNEEGFWKTYVSALVDFVLWEREVVVLFFFVFIVVGFSI